MVGYLPGSISEKIIKSMNPQIEELAQDVFVFYMNCLKTFLETGLEGFTQIEFMEKIEECCGFSESVSEWRKHLLNSYSKGLLIRWNSLATLEVAIIDYLVDYKKEELKRALNIFNKKSIPYRSIDASWEPSW